MVCAFGFVGGRFERGVVVFVIFVVERDEFVAAAGFYVFGVVEVVKPSHGNLVALRAVEENVEDFGDFLGRRGVEVQQLDVETEGVKRLLHVFYKPR